MAKIDLAVAKTMVQNYADTKLALINKTYGINDTKSIWFSIEEVRNFVSSLGSDITGVRIYLAAYGDKDTYPNQTTVVAIGTKADVTGHDADPIEEGAANPEGGSGQEPVNQGKICPPLCP